MYDNIGGKIKSLAKLLFYIESIFALIVGCVIIALDDDLYILSTIIMLVIPFFAYISSFLLYGFGELIEKTCDIERKIRGVSSGNKEDIISKL